MKNFDRFAVMPQLSTDQDERYVVVYVPESTAATSIAWCIKAQPQANEVIDSFVGQVGYGRAVKLAAELNAAYNFGFQHGRRATRDHILDALGFPNPMLDGEIA